MWTDNHKLYEEINIMIKIELLSVDFQKGFDEPVWGVRNNPDAGSKMNLLLSEWRDKGFTVIHIEHCSVEVTSPLRPGFLGNELKDEANPLLGVKVFIKTVNSSFIGTELVKYL
jgi:nicotinamidase-related amidase